MGKGNPFGNMNVPGLGNMMKQVQKMADESQRIEQELAAERLEASSGGGMVTAIVSGKGDLIDLKIDRQVVDPDDVEMLQDLVVSAIREALESGTKLREERLQALTGGMSIPGLF